MVEFIGNTHSANITPSTDTELLRESVYNFQRWK